jgi:hypothetical protein
MERAGNDYIIYYGKNLWNYAEILRKWIFENRKHLQLACNGCFNVISNVEIFVVFSQSWKHFEEERPPLKTMYKLSRFLNVLVSCILLSTDITKSAPSASCAYNETN